MAFVNNNTAARIRSNFWYVLPVFAGFVGGIISWFAIRYDDPRKAKNCLFLGIIMTAIPIILITIQLVMFSAPEYSAIPVDPRYRPPIVPVG